MRRKTFANGYNPASVARLVVDHSRGIAILHLNQVVRRVSCTVDPRRILVDSNLPTRGFLSLGTKLPERRSRPEWEGHLTTVLGLGLHVPGL